MGDSGKAGSIRFSVLVPVYNAEAFLKECVQSVLDQTCPAYELILVDDGSTDGSADICRAFSEAYPFIHTYRKENMGQLHTREYAAARASGDYCVFLDADDTLCPETLEVLSRKIAQTDADCVIYGLNRQKNGEIFPVITDSEETLIEDKRALYRKCFFNSVYNSMCTKAVKRTLLNTADHSPFYSVRHGEDMIQSMEILKNADRVLFLTESLYNYRVNAGSVSQSISTERTYYTDFTALEVLTRFLWEEHCFNADDYAAYEALCVSHLISKMKRACRSNAPFRVKKEILKEIGEQPFYREHIGAGGKPADMRGKVLLWLYRHRLYRPMILFAR